MCGAVCVHAWDGVKGCTSVDAHVKEQDENNDNHTCDHYISMILMCVLLFILQRISISNMYAIK